VWQSQAPAGISKFTGVDGCGALADAVLLFMVTPAAMEAYCVAAALAFSRRLLSCLWGAMLSGETACEKGALDRSIYRFANAMRRFEPQATLI
jgi:hypothetical protein